MKEGQLATLVPLSLFASAITETANKFTWRCRQTRRTRRTR